MKKKLTVAIVAIALVLCLSVGGTLAWLSATSSSVTNTFTVGNIEISLWETDANNEKDYDGINTYKIIPGTSESKDPTVTVTKGSEKCYVYVTVENNLVIGSDVVGTLDIDSENWEFVESSENTTLYRYKDVVDASAEDIDLKVFDTVTYEGEKITKENIQSLKDKTIVVNAYAYQADKVDQTTADAAVKELWLASMPNTKQ